MSRKTISLESLSEQRVSWLYFVSHNNAQLRPDPNVELLINYLKDIAPYVLSEYEYCIFCKITFNKEKSVDIANKSNVTKSNVSKAYRKACKKLKPFAKAFIKAMKIKNISEV